MIDTILSNNSFKPRSKLSTKYWTYVISIILAMWTLIFGFIGLIWLIADGDLPREVITVIYVILSTGLVVIAVAYPLVKWYFNSITYEIVEDEVHVFRGVITRTRKIVPYRTITNLDVKQGPYDRYFNLGTIEIQTAGNSANKIGPEERLDGLPGELVEDIQQILLSRVRRMRGSPATSHDVADEQTLLSDILYEIRELRKNLSKNS